MDFMFDWDGEGDRFSFEDSDRFEEDSLCSWVSEPESLCNNWRGWRSQNGRQYQYLGKREEGKVSPLLELAAQAVAGYIPFEEVENFYPPIPEELQLRIAFWSFPECEEDIRLYSCLANGSAEEFTKGEHLFKNKAVKRPLQIGFHLSATIEPPQQLASSKNPFNVSVVFDRRKISSSDCSCGNEPSWCSHVVAVCLFRIHQPSQVTLRAPVSESLSRLQKDQLQKFAQYLISELPRQILPTAQQILDELLSSQQSDINTVRGAPDPTAGSSSNEITRWNLDEATLHENIKKTLIKFCVPSPTILSDVTYLSSTAPPAASEWQSLLRPMRGREPEGMWNLLSIVKEMYKRHDSNAIPLLEILTDEILSMEQVMIWWFQTKVSASHTAAGSGGGSHTRSNAHQNCSSQHAASSLCEEIVSLWRLAGLNPSLAPIQREDLETQLKDWHIITIDKVRKARGPGLNPLANSGGGGNGNGGNGQNGIKKNDIEIFSGFKPAIEACGLDWEDYPIPGITYVERYPLQWHFSFGKAEAAYNAVNGQGNGVDASGRKNGAMRPRPSQVSGCGMKSTDGPLGHLFHLKSLEFRVHNPTYPTSSGSNVAGGGAGSSGMAHGSGSLAGRFGATSGHGSGHVLGRASSHTDGSSSEGFCEDNRDGVKDHAGRNGSFSVANANLQQQQHDSDSDLCVDIGDSAIGAVGGVSTEQPIVRNKTGSSGVPKAEQDQSGEENVCSVGTNKLQQDSQQIGTSANVSSTRNSNNSHNSDKVKDAEQKQDGNMSSQAKASIGNVERSANNTNPTVAGSVLDQAGAPSDAAAAGNVPEPSPQLLAAAEQPGAAAAADGGQAADGIAAPEVLEAQQQQPVDEYQMYFYDTRASKTTAKPDPKKKKEEPNYFAGIKNIENAQEILFARAEALHAHGHTKEACKLARSLAEEMLCNPPDLTTPPETPAPAPTTGKGKKNKKAANNISSFASSTLAKAAFLCSVLLEEPDCYHLAFRVGLFGLEMSRPPASSKVLEVKLAYQESELATLLKRIPPGPQELAVIRDRAEKLRDGKLKSRGDALLPLTLASFIFDSLCTQSSYQPVCRSGVKPSSIGVKLPSDEKLGFDACVAALGLKANVSEAEHPLLCEGTRRQRGELLVAMLLHYKDDQIKLSKIMDKVLDKEVHQAYKAPSMATYLNSKSAAQKQAALQGAVALQQHQLQHQAAAAAAAAANAKALMGTGSGQATSAVGSLAGPGHAAPSYPQLQQLRGAPAVAGNAADQRKSPSSGCGSDEDWSLRGGETPRGPGHGNQLGDLPSLLDGSADSMGPLEDSEIGVWDPAQALGGATGGHTGNGAAQSGSGKLSSHVTQSQQRGHHQSSSSLAYLNLESRFAGLHLEGAAGGGGGAGGAAARAANALLRCSSKDTDSSAVEDEGGSSNYKAWEAKFRCTNLRSIKKPSVGMASIDSSAPETTSSDNSPTLERRRLGHRGGAGLGGPGSDSGSSGKSSDSLGSGAAKHRDDDSPAPFDMRGLSQAPAFSSRSSTPGIKTGRLGYKKKSGVMPTVPNQPSEATAHFMFELAKTVLNKAGGSSSTSLFTQPTQNNNPTGPHRNLHLCAFQIGLYALGLHNCVTPNWLSRTYSSHVSWITGQATEIGSAAINILIDTWEGHLTPQEVASLADRASRCREDSMVRAAADLALSCLPCAQALNPNEIQRAMVQCKEQSREKLEKACLAVEEAAGTGGVYPDVLFYVAKTWFDLYKEAAKRTTGQNINNPAIAGANEAGSGQSDEEGALVPAGAVGGAAAGVVGAAGGVEKEGASPPTLMQLIPAHPLQPQVRYQVLPIPAQQLQLPTGVIAFAPPVSYALPPPSHGSSVPQSVSLPHSSAIAVAHAHHYHLAAAAANAVPYSYVQALHLPNYAAHYSTSQGLSPAFHPHNIPAYISPYQPAPPAGFINMNMVPGAHAPGAQLLIRAQTHQPGIPMYMNQGLAQVATACVGVQGHRLPIMHHAVAASSAFVGGQSLEQQVASSQAALVASAGGACVVEVAHHGHAHHHHHHHSDPVLSQHIHYLEAAYRVGMLAMETLARRVHEDRPQTKYAKNPPNGEDVKWLLTIAMKLGPVKVQQFCISAGNAVLSPFLLHEILYTSAVYLARTNNPTQLQNYMRTPTLNSLLQKCLHLYTQCAHQRMHHIPPSDYDDFVNTVSSARSAFYLTQGGIVQFNELLQSLRRNKSCKKELWQRIVTGLKM